MNSTQFEALLTDLNACEEARAWAKGKSLSTVYKTCKRGDWLLWLFGKMADKPGWPSRNAVILAACDCAEIAFKFLPKGETRPQECVAVVRSYCAGKATIGQVCEARRAAAYAAEAAAYAAAAYAAAAYAAAADAADADAAAYAAAAYAAAYAAAAAKPRLRGEMADLVVQAIREAIAIKE